MIAVKGKGEMEAWYVLGLRPIGGTRGHPEPASPAEAVPGA
jgi:hypothetical protein